MGTNFYLHTESREAKNLWFQDGEYEVVDEPNFGYQIHIAKTSCGWLPLFQAYKNVRSVEKMREIYSSGEFRILDEYGTEYSWEEFDDRVLKFGAEDSLRHRNCIVDRDGYEFVTGWFS